MEGTPAQAGLIGMQFAVEELEAGSLVRGNKGAPRPQVVEGTE